MTSDCVDYGTRVDIRQRVGPNRIELYAKFNHVTWDWLAQLARARSCYSAHSEVGGSSPPLVDFFLASCWSLGLTHVAANSTERIRLQQIVASDWHIKPIRLAARTRADRQSKLFQVRKKTSGVESVWVPWSPDRVRRSQAQSTWS